MEESYIPLKPAERRSCGNNFKRVEQLEYEPLHTLLQPSGKRENCSLVVKQFYSNEGGSQLPSRSTYIREEQAFRKQNSRRSSKYP